MLENPKDESVTADRDTAEGDTVEQSSEVLTDSSENISPNDTGKLSPAQFDGSEETQDLDLSGEDSQSIGGLNFQELSRKFAQQTQQGVSESKATSGQDSTRNFEKLAAEEPPQPTFKDNVTEYPTAPIDLSSLTTPEAQRENLYNLELALFDQQVVELGDLAFRINRTHFNEQAGTAEYLIGIHDLTDSENNDGYSEKTASLTWKGEPSCVVYSQDKIEMDRGENPVVGKKMIVMSSDLNAFLGAIVGIH